MKNIKRGIRDGGKNYGQLEKCYSVWICRDRIPKREWFSISGCKMCNYKTIGTAAMREADYDLMELVVVRLGSSDCPQEKEELFQFLTALFYPHRADFRERMERYIDFGSNPELEKEVADMTGLGWSILEEGRTKGKAEDILDLLADLGSIPAELSRRICAEEDAEKLRCWLKLAARADSVEQFAERM